MWNLLHLVVLFHVGDTTAICYLFRIQAALEKPKKMEILNGKAFFPSEASMTKTAAVNIVLK